jgi:leucyl-tRNA synthetase
MAFLEQIEEKWQKAWEQKRVFEANPDPSRKKFFITFPYAYMNGPLHVGHAFTASRVDAYARFKRMQGYNVLFPWAWHWTGQPLVGASERVAKGDEAFIKSLKEVDGVPDTELKKFVDPLYMATYYTNEDRIVVHKIGFSIDWRREFNTVMPAYQKFIEWQYENLRAKGYVTKGTHPVVWCPKDASPTGDADRQVGEGVTPEEYTLIKYQFKDNVILPAATFRPETVFAVTNLWINPEATYAETHVDNEKWIISEKATRKLAEQGRKISIERTFKGNELIGKTFENPVTHDHHLILPGWFVDPNQATGVVYSVPAHAPYDWLALRELQEKPETLKPFGIDSQTIRKLKPISMIKLEGYGEYPAIEIVEQLGVKDQKDPKADDATKLLYKKEFHSGVLKENCGEYAGKTVKEIKDALIRDFRKRNISDGMYDLPQEVICRCMTPCIVKVLQDQWFLSYSDPEWKEQAKQALSKMAVYPETARQWFLTVIDWLREWACARTTGFGTPLPWVKGWTVETLSDSTIYMAFYTINKHIRENDLKPEMLTRDFFDHVFYGKGKPESISARTGIDKKMLQAMREEFLYWYPVDLRVSAKELVPNHLTFFIFHHTALFPTKHWPKAVGVNGMLMIEGKQMHKSKGNFVTMKNAVQQYGADATRCALMLAAEGMDDPDWRGENAKDMQTKLEALCNFIQEIMKNSHTNESGHLEKWLITTLQHRIMQVTSSMEEMKTRTALQIALFETWNDFRWYIRRKGTTEADAIVKAVKIWLKLLAPFAPHLAEELWSKIDETSFISLCEWPHVDEKQIDREAEDQENLVKGVVEDTLNVLKATRTTPRKIYYYTSSSWKWRVRNRVVEKSANGTMNFSELMKEFSASEELKTHMKDIAKLVPKMAKEVGYMAEDRKARITKTEPLNEKQALEEAIGFLSERFNAEVTIFDENDKQCYDPKQRASVAMPGRPAIYVE